MKTIFTGAAMAAVLALSACGESTGERAISGGAIGAGAGAAGAAITGTNVVYGATLGAAAGAVTGAVTDEDDIYIGREWDVIDTD